MSATQGKPTAAWIAGRTPHWRELSNRLDDLEDAGRADAETVLRAVRSYPEVARDLAAARRTVPGSSLARQLEQTYARLHRAIFRPATSLRHDLVRLFGRDAPAVAYALRHRIVWVAVAFFLAASAGWWLVSNHPGLVHLVMSEQMVDTVRGGELWTDDLLNVVPSSVLAVGIFANNIAVALTAFCLGAVYGLGTIYIVALNGIMLGGAFAFTAQHQLAGRLAEFVAAHGFVELSVIFIASAIGFSIGEALARPGQRSRRHAFQRAAADGATLLLPCLLFLVGAGLIEGYISPDPDIPAAAKLAIGIGAWLVLLSALGAFPRRRRHRRLTPGAAP